jgi:hypothetical protein
MQKILIQIAEGRVVQIRGTKLLEMNSRDDATGDHDRWITLTLYYTSEKILVLVVEYATRTDQPGEQESPHVHVDRLRSWSELARALDTYDFMQHVSIDHYCGGHCSLMSGTDYKEAALRHRFRQTAMTFIHQCLMLRGSGGAWSQVDFA